MQSLAAALKLTLTADKRQTKALSQVKRFNPRASHTQSTICTTSSKKQVTELTYEFRCLKIDDMFYRIRIWEEGAVKPYKQLDVEDVNEGCDEESPIPSEWSEGDVGDEEWYVEESQLDGKNGGDTIHGSEMNLQAKELTKNQEVASDQRATGNRSPVTMINVVVRENDYCRHRAATEDEEAILKASNSRRKVGGNGDV
ncbi:hypothetical protein L6452_17818 [Arctium lappa]|uniref:Uncharacterized protein n=1 Tax=Arctium lappa TaxID=4217 RepID=A0ACB9C4A7_ARCLA|nr:hypothetical protein L6452_17818 [Arctium lappa]